ncbi:hypothetical protein [Paenibacillus ihumii]|uniref:hypothetical protein n=1 Tax=Paenibacillus ihumii TaxID=687436 RepID=UPI0006D800C6|nr:hypothetical protein [Paenibacillus ihumii]
MRVLNISYPTPLSEILNKDNDNIDVFIELEDGSKITLVVSTPENLISQMNKENVNYLTAPQPEIIVKSLTHENIKRAIEECVDEDAFWLKLLFVASTDKSVINMDKVNQYIKQLNNL